MLCYQLHIFNVCVSMRMDTHMCRHTRVCKQCACRGLCGGQGDSLEELVLFCPTTGILGMELQLSVWMVSVATCWPPVSMVSSTTIYCAELFL